jgi:NAD(P)-dependent dehydrogenase (short-subunit alcohol dehydrogenase family)
VVASPSANGQETVDLVTELGGSAAWVKCDVTDRADVDAAVAAAVDHRGRLDAMVHNATSRRSNEMARTEDVELELWQDHASVSLRGAFNCAQAAFPHLRATGGRLVLFTSPAALEGNAHLPVYGMVKGALRGLAKSLAIEWGPSGVTVACMSLLARTPALDQAMAEQPELRARMEAIVPLHRIGEPDTDIGPVVAFLAGDASRYITGQTLIVDGGRFTGL